MSQKPLIMHTQSLLKLFSDLLVLDYQRGDQGKQPYSGSPQQFSIRIPDL